MSHPLPVTGNTEHTKPENRAFYPALDGLRTVAFTMVFLQHYQGLIWGWTGVNVFFVLSGFLITGILFDARDDPHRVRNFYVRRTLRIFPLYYGIFLLLLLLYPLLHWRWSAAWLAWPLYVGNFINLVTPGAGVPGSALQAAGNGWLVPQRFPSITLYIGHFWSLCVEEQFYLFWPWVVFWVRSRRALIWICGTVVVVEPFLRMWVEHIAPAWAVTAGLTYRGTPFQLDALLLGGLVSLLWRGTHRRQLVLVGRIAAIAVSAAIVLYLAFTIHFSDPLWSEHYQYPTWLMSWGLTIANLWTAAIILCILVPAGFLYRFLSLAPLRWLGRISYGAYVFHDVMRDLSDSLLLTIVNALNFHRHGRLIFVTVPFALTILIAWLSFRFFESPFLELKERWTIRSGTPPASS